MTVKFVACAGRGGSPGFRGPGIKATGRRASGCPPGRAAALAGPGVSLGGFAELAGIKCGRTQSAAASRGQPLARLVPRSGGDCGSTNCDDNGGACEWPGIKDIGRRASGCPSGRAAALVGPAGASLGGLADLAGIKFGRTEGAAASRGQPRARLKPKAAARGPPLFRISYCAGASQTPTSSSYCVVTQPSACSGLRSSMASVIRPKTCAERESSIIAMSWLVITVS